MEVIIPDEQERYLADVALAILNRFRLVAKAEAADRHSKALTCEVIQMDSCKAVDAVLREIGRSDVTPTEVLLEEVTKDS